MKSSSAELAARSADASKAGFVDKEPYGSEPSLGEQLCGRIAQIAGQALPPEVHDMTVQLVLDSLGVTMGASRAPGIGELATAMRALEPHGGSATILIDGLTAGPATAALVNGAAAHALEFDDTHDTARIHALCAVLPAALAVAEDIGNVDGEMFVKAVAIGSEVFSRLGLSTPHFLDRGWHPTTAFGGVAAAVACAFLLRLDSRRMCHAAAIAYAQMCGNTQSIIDSSLTKRIGPGFAARNGVTAAYLARQGITGPRGFIDGRAGLFRMYEDRPAQAALLDGFGSEWQVLQLSIKPFPCCRCTHSLIQLGIELHRDGLRTEDVVMGSLLLGGVNHRVVHAPFNPQQAPDPVVHAQFNACYAFTRALKDGKVDLSTFSRERILEPASLDARKLTCDVSRTIPTSALAPAEVRLHLKDGTTRTAATDTLLGSPSAPLSSAQLRDKFAGALAWGHGVSREHSDRLAGSLLALGAGVTVEAMTAAVRQIAGTGAIATSRQT
jgi:2-methylcitrate dehydratase PrpD